MVSIRKVHLNDLEGLLLLFDAYRVFYKKDSDPEAGRSFLRERITRQESEILGAVQDDQTLLGFAQLYPLFSSTQMKRLWLLNDLYVAEAYRNQGIGRKLIEEAKKLCRATQAQGLILKTGKDNQAGNALYPRAGFVPDSAFNHYLWENRSG